MRDWLIPLAAAAVIVGAVLGLLRIGFEVGRTRGRVELLAEQVHADAERARK